jgi:hypothetical protein
MEWFAQALGIEARRVRRHEIARRQWQASSSPFAFGQVHRDLAERREVFGPVVGSDA